MARRASRAVPLRVSCLAFGPSMALRAEIHAVLTWEARPELRAGLTQSPVIVSHPKILLIQQLAQIHSFKFQNLNSQVKNF